MLDPSSLPRSLRVWLSNLATIYATDAVRASPAFYEKLPNRQLAHAAAQKMSLSAAMRISGYSNPSANTPEYSTPTKSANTAGLVFRIAQIMGCAEKGREKIWTGKIRSAAK